MLAAIPTSPDWQAPACLRAACGRGGGGLGRGRHASRLRDDRALRPAAQEPGLQACGLRHQPRGQVRPAAPALPINGQVPSSALSGPNRSCPPLAPLQLRPARDLQWHRGRGARSGLQGACLRCVAAPCRKAVHLPACAHCARVRRQQLMRRIQPCCPAPCCALLPQDVPAIAVSLDNYLARGEEQYQAAAAHTVALMKAVLVRRAGEGRWQLGYSSGGPAVLPRGRGGGP